MKKKATKSPTGTRHIKRTPSHYVARLHAARRQLAAARRGLARTTRPSGPVYYVEPKWQWAERLLKERLPEFLRNPQVVGAGLGTKTVKGQDTNVPCLTIFVRRKQQRGALKELGIAALPRFVKCGGRTLPTDIVAVGTLKRQTSAGQSCSTSQGVTRTGTIGAPAVDEATGAAVFITAMHVTGHSEISGGTPTVPVNAPSVRDVAGAPVIGRVLQGSRTGIDAAKVSIQTPHSVLREVPAFGTIRGWRPLTFPGDKGTSVSLFGATSGRLLRGVIVNPGAFMGGFGLETAITVSGLQTAAGDSGAALVDAQGFVLGFLVGAAADGLRVFCSASLVLERLGCDIPTIVS